jgi:5'-nucleotidase
MKRRKFIGSILLAGGATVISPKLVLGGNNKGKIKKLVILHTNDMHSHIEPFADNDPKYPGKGGIAKRAKLIRQIREEGNDVLLFDCGDIFQGTPYFNYYLGELEIKLMNEMKYDAVTIGNHDFDGGLDNLVEKVEEAGFTFINCNYDFSGSPLKDKVVPYKIFKKAGLTIGVLGVGIKLEGLVDKKLFGSIVYNDPVEHANKIAAELKNKKKCDIVICLSHLGYEYKGEQVSDLSLAKQSSDIDIILGGHTHTFLKEGTKIDNKIGKKVIVSQAGWAGLILGRINVIHSPETLEVSMFSDTNEIS